MVMNYSSSMPRFLRTILNTLMRDIREQKILPFLIVFGAFFLGAKFGQYFYLNYETSPALILPTAGIALAAVLLRGYRMWVPIALASLIASLTSPQDPPTIVLLAATLGQTLQPIAGAFFLKKLGFEMTFDRTRDVLFFTGVAFVSATIAPTIIVAAQAAAGSLMDSLYLTWSRGWAGRLLSMLIITPLLLSWLLNNAKSLSRKEVVENMLAFGLLLLSTYLLFWLPIAQSLAFLFLLLLMMTLFWVALRMNFRLMALAFFLITSLGIAGAIEVADALPMPLNQRLFSIELFMTLIAPIFFLFSALVKERRIALAISRRRAQELEEAMLQLEKSDRAKDEFIATLAHELRNPLAALQHELELIKFLGMRRRGAADSLSAAMRQTKQIDRMLRNLLDTARAQQGKIELRLKAIDAAQVASHAIETVRPLLLSGNQIFTHTVTPKSFFIVCDPMRIEQIIVNLLSNAVKYTAEGGRIEFIVRRQDKVAEFIVKDTGRGIAADMIQKIFDIFVQAAHTNLIQAGLGIGLTLSRNLAQLHGGTLTAVSGGVGKGSEFTLRIPLTNDLAMPHKERKRKAATQKSRTPRRVLVVDDNVDLATAFEKILGMLGHDVRTVHDGNLALKAALEFHPSVVFLDLAMPNKDGYAIAREMRLEPTLEDVSIIALSGYGQEEDRARTAGAGFDGHVVKPISIENIRGILKKPPQRVNR
ncbi:MAG: Multi-sensor hybrid histidine kinase [Parcubacteria group bacterium GW2011_GWA2_51_10]|nr:MAG: Multi-sensor hybrid histidine kinase [Parcubacteria group bacterium GW2011_GWA2_51_10]